MQPPGARSSCSGDRGAGSGLATDSGIWREVGEERHPRADSSARSGLRAAGTLALGAPKSSVALPREQLRLVREAAHRIRCSAPPLDPAHRQEVLPEPGELLGSEAPDHPRELLLGETVGVR